MHYFISKLCFIAILISTLSCQAMAANEQLVFALDLIRHGDRTGIDDLPTAPHSWSEGKGQLTALGMQQEYQLGLKLYQRYMIKNQLLPKNYQTNTIYARSTDYDRTLMSATAVLIGLYPPGTGPILPNTSPALPSNFQPIPIHTIPAADDRAFLINISSEKISNLLNKYVYTREDWRVKWSELETHYPRWSQLTGIPIKNVFDIVSIGDTLNTYVVHDVALPNGLIKEEANKIIEAANWLFATLFKPKEIGDVVGKAALQKIVEHINQVAENKTKAKFILLSAHDVTILGVMSALHAPLDSAPPYASDLNFSLYESGSENYFVKITYNDMPVHIPACNGNACTLSQLDALIM